MTEPTSNNQSAAPLSVTPSVKAEETGEINGRSVKKVQSEKSSPLVAAKVANVAKDKASVDTTPIDKKKAADAFFHTRKYEIADREALKTMRQHIKEQLQIKKPQEVSRQFTEELKEFMTQVYKDGVDYLEKQFSMRPPCEYCVVALGSIARGESGPYTDFDNLIVIKNATPQNEKYFEQLTQYVADRLERLGESDTAGLERLGEAQDTGTSGVRICRGLTVPYVAYNFRFERSKKTTENDIEELEFRIKSLSDSSYSNNIQTRATLERTLKSLKKEVHTSPHQKGENQFLIDVDSWKGPPELWGDVNCGVALDISGLNNEMYNIDLYNNFKKEAFKKLSPKELLKKAIERQTNDMNERSPLLQNPIISPTLPSIIHIKEDLLRLPTVLRVLGSNYGIQELSTVRCIERLHETIDPETKEAVLPEQLTKDLIAAVNCALKWRMQVQLEYKREYEMVTTTPGRLESFKKDLENAIRKLDFEILSLGLRSVPQEQIENARQTRRRYRNILKEDIPKIEKHPKAFSENDVKDLKNVVNTLKDFYEFLKKTS